MFLNQNFFIATTEIFLKTDNQPFYEFNRMYYEVRTDYDFKKYRKLGLSTFYHHRYSSLKDDRVIVEGKYLILIDDDKRKKKKIEK